MGLGYRLGCVQNPAVGERGKPSVLDAFLPSPAPKKWLWWDAGPAGLEAAAMAALRKHQGRAL